MDGGFAEHFVAFNDEEEEQHYHGETEQGLRTQNFNDVDDSGGNDNDHRRGGDSSAGKLFVGGLAWETTEGAFTNYFSKYGEVVDSVIMLDKISGRPRGFGFVTFADPVVAEKVLDEEHVIDGRPVEVKRTVPREEMQVKGVQRTRKIFVGGIPPSFTEDELKEYFSSYGIVAEHQIMFDRETGRSRGFGFVTFQDEETVERIVSDGSIHELGGKEVEIKKAVPKRAGGDFNYDSRPRHGGSSKSYGGFGGEVGEYRGGRGGAGDYGGGRGGKSSRGYGAYAAGGAYGAYGGNYGGAAAAGFYGGYGGYGYGFGYWGPMYNGGYGAAGFGPSGGYGGAGAMAGYGGGGVGAAGGAGYGGGKGYGSGGGGGGGGSGGGGSGYGGGKGYSSSGGGSGGKGYGNGGAASGRYHPY